MSKKLTKYSFHWQKLRNSFSLTQSKSGPVPKFMNHFTVRIQSKINKIRHRPDPVQTKSSPMLISGYEHESGLDQDWSQFLPDQDWIGLDFFEI